VLVVPRYSVLGERVGGVVPAGVNTGVVGVGVDTGVGVICGGIVVPCISSSLYWYFLILASPVLGLCVIILVVENGGLFSLIGCQLFVDKDG